VTIDFTSFLVKKIRQSVIERLNDVHGHKSGTIIKSTNEFVNDLEFVSYSLCKILLIDPMVRHFLKSNVAVSITLFVCEALAKNVTGDDSTVAKFDTEHISMIMESLRETVIHFHGYKKFVLF
jgi:hypothetical protein